MYLLKSAFIFENPNIVRIFAAMYHAYNLGLTGFDSGLEWYVSTRSVGCLLLNISGQEIYLAKTSTLSLPNRSIVDYRLYPTTR